MSGLPVRVVKVGGSLLERDQLPRQLHFWLQAQSPALHIFFAGGGDFVEPIKNWQPRFRLSDALCHWLCVEALGITAQVLQQVLGCARVLRWSELQMQLTTARSKQQPLTLVFDIQQFLREIEPSLPPETLPHNWQVTTDSLAARLAEALNADELILLKSRACPADEDDLGALAALGYVDAYFARIAPRLRRIVFQQLPLQLPDAH